MPYFTQLSIRSQDPLPLTSVLFSLCPAVGAYCTCNLNGSSAVKPELSHFTDEEPRPRAACARNPDVLETATRPRVPPQGVAGFVPEGRALVAGLWDTWLAAVLPAERGGEAAACLGVLAGLQESLVFLVLGNGIDMDRKRHLQEPWPACP